MVFLLSAIVCSFDPGGLTGYVVIPAIAMSIGYPMGYNPVLIGIITIFGTQATIITPFGVFGNIANNILTEYNYENLQSLIIANMTMMFFIGALLVYTVFKGWKLNENQSIDEMVEGDILGNDNKFNRNQMLTLVALVIMIAIIMLLKTHAGLTALFFSAVLLSFKVADEEAVFKGVPWATIILIVGMSTLLSVIELLGGMTLLANFLSSISNRWTAAPLIGMTSSIMSFFSLAMAGPVPTLMPTIESLNASIGNIFEPIELLSTIFVNGFTAAISPLSLGGAMVLAAYVTLFKPSVEERQKVFGLLFAVAIVFSIFAALLSNTGIYRILEGII